MDNENNVQQRKHPRPQPSTILTYTQKKQPTHTTRNTQKEQEDIPLFLKQKIKAAIDIMKTNKSPDEDRITNEKIKAEEKVTVK